MTTVYVCSNPVCTAIWESDPQGHCPACCQKVEGGISGWSTMAIETRVVPAPLPKEPWEVTTRYGRADLTLHPLVREAYKVACLIERCGASPELTTASCTAFALCESLSDYMRVADNGS